MTSTRQRPADRDHHRGPLTDNWDDVLKRAVKGAHEDVLKETERLRRLGIIDEQGRLLKKS